MFTFMEIFVEDASGKILLEQIMQKLILREEFFYEIHGYRGCGSLPKNLSSSNQVRTKALLNNIPRLVRGFVNKFEGLKDYRAVFVIVTDCDDNNCVKLKSQIQAAIYEISGKKAKNVVVCLAIEEMEAWLLGDFEAIRKAYPNANKKIYDTYVQDSICGTWEKLAKVIDEKQYKKISKASYNVVGPLKCEWSEKIGKHLNIHENRSPSLNYYVKKITMYLENNQGA